MSNISKGKYVSAVITVTYMDNQQLSLLIDVEPLEQKTLICEQVNSRKGKCRKMDKRDENKLH